MNCLGLYQVYGESGQTSRQKSVKINEEIHDKPDNMKQFRNRKSTQDAGEKKVLSFSLLFFFQTQVI